MDVVWCGNWYDVKELSVFCMMNGFFLGVVYWGLAGEEDREEMEERGGWEDRLEVGGWRLEERGGSMGEGEREREI